MEFSFQKFMVKWVQMKDHYKGKQGRIDKNIDETATFLGFDVLE